MTSESPRHLGGVTCVLKKHNLTTTHSLYPYHPDDEFWVCVNPLTYTFAVLVSDGTLFPISVGCNRIVKPCEFVVVINQRIHDIHRVSLVYGDTIEFTSDEDKKGGLFNKTTWASSNPVPKRVGIEYSSDRYDIFIMKTSVPPFIHYTGK